MSASEAAALSAGDRELLRQLRPASELLNTPHTGRDRPERDGSGRDGSGRDSHERDLPGRERFGAVAASHSGSVGGDGQSARSSPDVENASAPVRRARVRARPLSGEQKAAWRDADDDVAFAEPTQTSDHPQAEASGYSRTSERARRAPASRRRAKSGYTHDDAAERDVDSDNDPDSPDATANARASRGRDVSLKARAVDFLSRREHSRHELARKLARYSDDPDEIAAVLDGLQRENWLSDERFATSLIHRRASRQGTSRIVQELRQHGVAPEAVSEVRDTLRATEFERAQDVWRRRYGQPPRSPAERARQQRFLAARGFEHEVVRRVVGPVVDDASTDEHDD